MTIIICIIHRDKDEIKFLFGQLADGYGGLMNRPNIEDEDVCETMEDDDAKLVEKEKRS